MLRRASLVCLAALIGASAPAQAQKSADTLRLAINDMFPYVHPYLFPQPEQWSFTLGVYQGLLGYDERNSKTVGILASDWRRIDDKVIEFDLRPNVKFHNGDVLTAEDFKATYEWAANPKSGVRTPGSYNWVERVEVLGPHKIRVHAKRPDQSNMLRFSYNMKVMNKKAHESHADPGDYGRLTPWGTGPYRVVSIDRNDGVLVERSGHYDHDPAGYFRAPVKRVKGIPIRDRQTQQAQLMVGGLDLVRAVLEDNAKSLAVTANMGVTASPSAMILYAHFDAMGRSADKSMMDERVRKAFIMAIDRKTLVHNIIPGGDIAEMPPSICFKATIACKVDNKPFDYDPAQAKRLLAEAGYPNGLDLTLYTLEPLAYFATAIAGEVRKVGIRANVEAMPQSLYIKKRADGDLTAYVGTFPTGVSPDAGALLKFFFNKPNDYWGDDEITKAWSDGELEFDLAKRVKLYTPALNRINDKAYFLPISELPVIWAHSKDVKVLPNPLSTADPKLGDFVWADYSGK